MSDASGGPGWWQASDGKWYPPEQNPGNQNASTQPGTWSPQQQPVLGSPQQPKKRHLFLKIVGGLFAFFILLGIVGAISDPESSKDAFKEGFESASETGEKSESTTTEKPKEVEKAKEPEKTTTTKPGLLFPGRIDAQKEDQERNIGEAARLSGYTSAVTSAVFRQSFDSYSKAGYVVVNVSVENRDDRAQAYSPSDWKIQLPSGQVIDHTYESDAGKEIGSGDLVKGGKAQGVVVFETGNQKGDYYIIYKPDPYDAARGIWKVTV